MYDNKLEKAIDLYGSTLLLNDIQRYIICLFKDASGILHFSSQTSISRYEFIKLALKILKIPTKIIGRNSNSLNLIAERPKNTVLYSEKVTYDFTKEQEGLEFIYNQIKNRGEYVAGI